ncbi:MAG: ABC transporter ATP-binding protein [Armatimonadota bacterium]|nr:ABC transporter ATP-binding protein [Armatimonadota bacterium]
MGEPLIRIVGLYKSFGDRKALEDIHLEVYPGEIMVIMGPSGCGKTVLLKHLIGLLHPDAGEVLVDGQRIHSLHERELNRLRQRIGIVFQTSALFDSMTVGENVAFPLRQHRKLPEWEVQRLVREKLTMVGMEGTEHLFPSELSGGMRKRVAIARALVLEPEILLYDEPTAGLDPIMSRAIDELILRLRRELGVTSLVVTHDLHTAFSVADRIAVLDEGRIIEVGTREEIRNSKNPVVIRFLQAGTPPPKVS